MKTSKQIIFFGADNFSVTSLQHLIDKGFPIACVITKPDAKKGRGRNLEKTPLKELALKYGIEVRQPETLIDIINDIKKTENRLGVLVSYGQMIPAQILALFEPIGIINLHPSLLPKYRGPSPIESAILNGDKITGISLIKLTNQMDAGPIYHQTPVEINNLGAIELYQQLSEIGAKILIEFLPQIENGTVSAHAQDSINASYTHLLKKSDGFIDWNNSTKNIIQGIKAYEIWPKSHTKIGNVDVIIHQAHVEPSRRNSQPGAMHTDHKTSIAFTTQDGLIGIDVLQPLGKKPMDTKSFLAGYNSKLGD